MNNINNMGGILFAEILNTDEIACLQYIRTRHASEARKDTTGIRFQREESLKLQLSLPMILKTQESHISIQRPSSFPDPH